ncbi:MAG: hypothetical protein HY553_15640 [Elusimicrobia bacterium]|nr:hypothetical protein [Elusimicrobiota bacterium]
MILALLAAAALAQEPVFVDVPRKIAVLYRSSQIPDEVKDVFFHPFHVRAEIVLNHLGLAVDYIDADRPLPDPALPGVRGIAAWLPAGAAFDDARGVCRWLEAAMRGGKRVALLGELGVYKRGTDGKLAAECASVLKLLGVEGFGYKGVDAMTVRLATHSALIGFERKPDPSEKGSVPLVRLLPGATAHATLAFSDRPGVSQPVAVSARGGIALDPFWLYHNAEIDPPATRWVVDPFAFFEEAFDLRGLPRPDVTTLGGRRMFLSQVDGDGFYNLSELDRKKLSGEIFLREVVAKEQDMPFTVSLVAGYFDLQLYNDAASLDISRRLLDQPNVEPACHGYAHPLVWRQGTVAVSIPRYRMSVRQEIEGATELLENRVLAGRRKIRVFLWTGDGQPGPDALELVERRGMLAMNGGGGRMDRVFPTYATLFPFSRPVGRFRQVYTPMPNEEDFTSVWSERFYGYRDVIETFERTGAPRRIKPVNVYVHLYTAERYAALDALRRVLAWVRAQPVVPVFASRYIRSVNAFFDLRVLRAGPRRFRLEGGADLGTVRFDGDVGWPDVAASRGVIGYKREGRSLYVHLDGSVRRELVLAAEAKPGLRLEEASFEVSEWSSDGGGVRFRRAGWWLDECVLAGSVPGAAYRVTSGAFSERVVADAAGRLSIRFPDAARGKEPLEVKVERA